METTRRPSRPLGLGLLAVAAAVALVYEIRSNAPPAHRPLTGGGEGGLELMLFTNGPIGVASVPDQGSVSAGALLRFRVRASAACHLRILSVDASGEPHRLYPPRGDGGGIVGAGEQDLPGEAFLDHAIGPERVYAICTPHALPWSAAEASARAAIARPAGVRAAAPLRGLPAGAAWQSILLEKRP